MGTGRPSVINRKTAVCVVVAMTFLLPSTTLYVIGASAAFCRGPQGDLPAGLWHGAERLVAECIALGEDGVLDSAEDVERTGDFYDAWFHAKVYVAHHPSICDRWMWSGVPGLRCACMEAYLEGIWPAEKFNWPAWLARRASVDETPWERMWWVLARVLARVEKSSELTGQIRESGVGIELWAGLAQYWVRRAVFAYPLQELPPDVQRGLVRGLDMYQWDGLIGRWRDWLVVQRRRVVDCRQSVLAYQGICRHGLETAYIKRVAVSAGLPKCAALRRDPWGKEKIEAWCREMASRKEKWSVPEDADGDK